MSKDIFNSPYYDEKTGKIIKIIPELNNVVNYYHLGLKDGDVLPDNYIYIGRNNYNPILCKYGQSIYHNPFFLKKTKDKEQNIKLRIEAVENFKVYLWKKLISGEFSKKDFLLLKDKKKVCFCADYLCHGHIIELFLYYIVNFEEQFDLKVKNYSQRNNCSK